MKCDKCGFDNVENAEYCQECGNKLNEYPSKYENISSLGFAGTLIFPPLAIIIGIYLLTRPEKHANNRGKVILGLCFYLWTLYAIVYLKVR